MSCGKRKRLTLAQKIEIIKFVEAENVGVRAVAEKFSIGKTQVSDILKNKLYLSQTFVEQGNDKSKRKFPKSDGEIIDTVIYQWYLHARVNNLPISGPVLKEKALELASEVGLNDFKASNGWLQKFKERHQISYKNIYADPALIKECVITEWLNSVKETIKDYKECDIFNCDETGLFYRILPENTMSFINEACIDGNLSKERLTIMLCTNIDGEFEKPLIIGKVGKYNCFKNINIDNPEIVWKSNTKAWMTRSIMTEWILDFDYRMTQSKRNIVLFLDNASSHPLLNNLQSIKLIFFPPYISSNCQPLNLGIIQNFKMLYRQCLLKHRLLIMDNGSGLINRINVLHAILWIKCAINQIKKSTVRNSFIKSGILISGEKQSEDNLATNNDYKALLNRLVGDDSINYAGIDDKLMTENQSLDLIKIMQEIIDPQISDEDEDDTEDDTSYLLNEDIALTNLGQISESNEKKKN
ncbi:tigger transposable element-derived protein 4 isoform X1 [Rhopalosiphum padi]|uniref:tigger transposable element-derived protein 4 isoform X1 n=1 Tax=Rhopalosiphum padi TaxID=40932 RepID=UPI00298DE603|nr:tigger transposable element-derived protein 4 isoform X1 [Rhopalosiphum padi]